MHTQNLILLTVIAIVAALLPAGVVLTWTIWKRHMDTRRSPLTTELYPLPGERAGSQAVYLMDKATERILMATTIGPIALAVWAFQRIDLHLIHFGSFELILLVVVAIASFWLARSGVTLIRTRRQYLDGLAAERATAQELAPLIAKGCAIYHDIPAEQFNLDHVVIGPSKVYMIETKSRQKPGGRGNASAQVKFDGKALIFPNWRDTQMLDQTRAEARWLSEYLYRKTGDRVPVEPVLSLPGWYVSRSVSTSDVHVINPKMHDFMTVTAGKPIPDAQRRRIMTALEERYRVTDPPAALAEYHV